MFKVEITYKSGKVETAEIAIANYASALSSLIDEGRLVSMIILEVI